jgi:16S rRNA (uracil1498-N3)-methyltransferase
MKSITNHNDTFKLPRLYVEMSLQDKGVIELESSQVHYLHNVLRKKEGDFIRLFNGKDGEWLGALTGIEKKSASVTLIEQLLEQPQNTRRVHLIFTPIKKHRMDWLIEKAVELGATDFHPIITQNTQNRKIKQERLTAQIFEAAEQCERLEIPALHGLEKLDNALDQWPEDTPILACIERFDAKDIKEAARAHLQSDIAVLIGPEGGFTKEEKQRMDQKTTPVSLGETILRCETAVAKALILLNA